MYGDTRRRHPVRWAIGGGLAALIAGLAPTAAAGAAAAAPGAAPHCGAGAAADARASGPKVAAKLPATLKRGAKPVKVALRVTNPSGTAHKKVRASVSIFGAASASGGGGTYLTTKDVRIDQYIPRQGWRRVRLETGCDPSLGRTLWPANGFTLRPGATYRTTLRVAVTRHADARIKKAELDVGAGTGSWDGGRYRSIRLTG